VIFFNLCLGPFTSYTIDVKVICILLKVFSDLKEKQANFLTMDLHEGIMDI